MVCQKKKKKITEIHIFTVILGFMRLHLLRICFSVLLRDESDAASGFKELLV